MSARKIALRVLTSCRKSGAWADAAIAAQLKNATLSAADSALCSRIVYGVLQNQIYLDYIIRFYLTQKPEKLQPQLPEILRIGAYQILFLDRVPDHAAVNESVELAKSGGLSKASGLVNAVLRKISDQKNHLPPLPKEAKERLSVQYSAPPWLVDRAVSLLGEEAEAFLKAQNEEAPTTAQCNPLKTTPERLLDELQNCGVNAKRHPWAKNCLELTGSGDLTTLKPFYDGGFTVQDTAAALVASAIGLKGGENVLDVCAAPGGKSFSAAFAMGNRGHILSCDLHENKLTRIREGAKRLGVTCIETACADGRKFFEKWENQFDVVICDVPCSGIGIIRKKPDIRYKDPAQFSDLPAIQAAILQNAARYVTPGGILLYSTCTVLPEENEQVTEAFLQANCNYSYDHFTLPIGSYDGHITFWPHRHQTDGFYLAKMRKAER